jgi:two-component system response regulator
MRHRLLDLAATSLGLSDQREPAPRGPASDATPARAAGPGPDGKWILLVEDNAYDEALTLRAFRKSGLDSYVAVARDGVEALNRLFGSGRDDADAPGPGPLPRLVLLDLQLPRIDGFEVLRRLRARAATRLVPVVILSSSLEREDLATSYALGANSYIRKPVDFNQFIEAVRQLGIYWLVLNEIPPR